VQWPEWPGLSPWARCLPWRQIPVILINVVRREHAVRQGIVWIQRNRLVQKCDAFVEAIFGEQIGVILALEIGLVSLLVRGGTKGQLLPVFRRKLGAQFSRYFPRNVVLYFQQFGDLAIILLAPELFSVANVIELNIDREIVPSLRDATRENGLHAESITDFLKVCRLTLVAKSDAVGDNFQAGQPRHGRPSRGYY
jgi:hypothetical protein